MGLDMNMRGRKINMNWGEDAPNQDGFLVAETVLDLGYWRKHPNLHGYIVENFADGIDECQSIELGENDILQIINAIEEDNLPQTEGFFFGSSPERGSEYYEEVKQSDLEIFNKIWKWMQTKEDKVYRAVEYRASW